MRYFVTALLLLTCTTIQYTAVAQDIQQQVDSLRAVLQTSKPDTNKVLLLHAISYKYFSINPDTGIQYGQKALKLAQQLKYREGIAKANMAIGRCHAIQDEYPKALYYFQAALVEAEKLKNQHLIAPALVSIGAVYTRKDEYETALTYLMRAQAAYAIAGVENVGALMDNIGNIYFRQDKYAEALGYYKQSATLNEKFDPGKQSLAASYCNLGAAYIALDDYNNALKYLFSALAIQEQTGKTRRTASTFNNIGKTYLNIVHETQAGMPDSLKDRSANLKKALYYEKQSMAICEELGLQDMLESVYSNISQIYYEYGDLENTTLYFDKYDDIKDSLRDIQKEKDFARVEAQYFFLKKTDSLKYQHQLKDEEIKKSKLERNGYVLVISLIGLISVLLINRQKLKHQQKRKLAETEAEHTKQVAQQQLEAFTKNIQEKNQLIETFAQEIEKYKALPCSNELPEKDKSLETLQGSVILTEEQWVDFQALFDKVYVGYIGRAKEKFQDLTPAELRFIVITRLGLNNKEMAAMLGVGAEAIRVSKHRIIKKIKPAEGATLEEIINSI